MSRRGSRRNLSSQMDVLEVRRLLAFSAYNPKNGHINVTGTSADDTITVALSTDASQVDVTLNGTTESFNRSAGVRLIIINAGDGNDTVSIQSKIQAHVTGGNGNDSISGVAENDEFEGDAGNDTLDGGGGDDVLIAGVQAGTDDGDDRLLGQAGNDTIITAGGTDSIDGGSGTDTADFSAFADNLTLSLDNVANDGITGQSPASNLFAIENVLGGQGNDSIVGNSKDNSLRGNNGNDTIFGQGGDDNINAGLNASVSGGSGDDTIFSITGTIFGDGGDDKIFATAATGETGGTVDGGSGDDQLTVQGTGFTVKGESGNDQVNYTDDPNDPSTATGEVSGGSGSDQLALNLSISTGIGYQISFDHVANDGVRGVAGTMNFRPDFETITGSQGDDTLDATGMPNGVSIVGGDGNDTITGTSFADTLDGQGGNDSINAGAGNDSINSADSVADTLDGGNGTDTATVDSGTDTVSNVENVS